MAFRLDRSDLTVIDAVLTLDVPVALCFQLLPGLIDLHHLVFVSIPTGIIFIQASSFMRASAAVRTSVHFHGLCITVPFMSLCPDMPEAAAVMAAVVNPLIICAFLHVVMPADVVFICACFHLLVFLQL